MHNKFAVLLLAAAFSACAHTRRPAQLAGWVSDANCTTQHVGGKNPGCVRKCLKGGAHIGHPEWTPQAMVLVVDGSNEIVVIDNPELLAGREAQHVTITGEVNAGHVRVRSVS